MGKTLNGSAKNERPNVVLHSSIQVRISKIPLETKLTSLTHLYLNFCFLAKVLFFYQFCFLWMKIMV